MLVRTIIDLAACGMYNLHHSFEIDTRELRDTPSLSWPEATTAATPAGACACVVERKGSAAASTVDCAVPAASID